MGNIGRIEPVRGDLHVNPVAMAKIHSESIRDRAVDGRGVSSAAVGSSQCGTRPKGFDAGPDPPFKGRFGRVPHRHEFIQTAQAAGNSVLPVKPRTVR